MIEEFDYIAYCEDVYNEIVDWAREPASFEDWLCMLKQYEDYPYYAKDDKLFLYKLFEKLDNAAIIPDNLCFGLLIWLYQWANVTKDYINLLVQAYSKYSETEKMITRQKASIDLREYIDPENNITLYRGASSGSWEMNEAISFTLDKSIAEGFARQSQTQNDSEDCYIYTVKTNVSNIIFYMNNREESELIILPCTHGTKIEILSKELVNRIS